MSTRRRTAVILAAGKGTRMRSDLPKVLHEAAGRPLLAWALDAAHGAGCDPILVVVGHRALEVQDAFADEGVLWVLQSEQRGTGHAMAQTESLVPEGSLALVLPGDAPLVTPSTLERLAGAAARGWGAVAVAQLEEPGSLGRVLLTPDGSLGGIVEARDASPEQLAIRRVNTGFYAVSAPEIFRYLAALSPDNAQGELYLTDAVVAAARQRRVEVVTLDDPSEALGVNTRDDLRRVEQALQARRSP